MLNVDLQIHTNTRCFYIFRPFNWMAISIFAQSVLASRCLSLYTERRSTHSHRHDVPSCIWVIILIADQGNGLYYTILYSHKQRVSLWVSILCWMTIYAFRYLWRIFVYLCTQYLFTYAQNHDVLFLFFSPNSNLSGNGGRRKLGPRAASNGSCRQPNRRRFTLTAEILVMEYWYCLCLSGNKLYHFQISILLVFFA